MAARIQAINAYRPKIDLADSVQQPELVRLLADRTGLNEGEVSLVLKELRDVVIFYNREARGVKLEGLGTYLPKIGLDGRFSVSHRLDRDIVRGINTPGTFTGIIINDENIGKTADELVAMWNAAHPDDPVT
jgi:hypothetical protein